MVGCVVATGVAQVDPADERDIPIGIVGAAQHHQLLVVRTRHADPLVEQHLAARVADLVPELAVLFLAVGQRIGVRTPHQTLHDHPAAGGIAEELGERRTRVAEPLIGVTPPVGEEQMITGTQRRHFGREPVEVGGPVHQRGHGVARAPGRQPARRITALGRREEPVVDRHARPPRLDPPGNTRRRAPTCPDELPGSITGSPRRGLRAPPRRSSHPRRAESRGRASSRCRPPDQRPGRRRRDGSGRGGRIRPDLQDRPGVRRVPTRDHAPRRVRLTRRRSQDEEHLLVGRQRPEVVGDDRLRARRRPRAPRPSPAAARRGRARPPRAAVSPASPASAARELGRAASQRRDRRRHRRRAWRCRRRRRPPSARRRWAPARSGSGARPAGSTVVADLEGQPGLDADAQRVLLEARSRSGCASRGG